MVNAGSLSILNLICGVNNCHFLIVITSILAFFTFLVFFLIVIITENDIINLIVVACVEIKILNIFLLRGIILF